MIPIRTGMVPDEKAIIPVRMGLIPEWFRAFWDDSGRVSFDEIPHKSLQHNG